MFNQLSNIYNKLKPSTPTVIEELLEKVESNRLLYQENQNLLLTLMNTHRREILERFEDLKTHFMDVVSPPPHTAGGADLSGHKEAATFSLKALQTIADSQETISYLYPNVQQKYLGEISKLIADFVNSAAELRERCMHEHDILVPECIEWYTEQAGNVCAKTPRPRELTFRLHGLPRVLENLCWCLNEGCVHTIIPQGNQEVIAVSVVHPGESWDDVRRYMFAAIKAVTLLDGDIFDLITTAVVREKWAEKVIDEDSWKKWWMDLDEVDVMWPAVDDDGEYSLVSSSSVRRYARSMYQGSTASKDMWGVPRKTSPESERRSSASVANSVETELSPSSKVSNSSSETIPGILKSGSSNNTRSSRGSSTVRFASTTSTSGTTQERGGHSNLRRRSGSSSLRGPSFISPMKDDRKSQTSVVTHPFLKRGAGANRKSMPTLR